jgi:hypothetical protein
MSGTVSAWIRRFGSKRVGDLRCWLSGSRGRRNVRDALASKHPAWRMAPGLLCFWALLTAVPASGTIDDAIASALKTIGEYAKQGYTVHEEDEWGGDLGVRQFKEIPHQLVQGNDYWFCLGTDVDNARVAIHVYNEQGQLVETKAWQDGSHAAAEAVNPATANYYIVVQITSSPAERTHWAMVYGTKTADAQKPL